MSFIEGCLQRLEEYTGEVPWYHTEIVATWNDLDHRVHVALSGRRIVSWNMACGVFGSRAGARPLAGIGHLTYPLWGPAVAPVLNPAAPVTCIACLAQTERHPWYPPRCP
jgi:hypothetical protein